MSDGLSILAIKKMLFILNASMLTSQCQISPFQALDDIDDEEYFYCLFQGFIPSMINVLELSVTNYAT